MMTTNKKAKAYLPSKCILTLFNTSRSILFSYLSTVHIIDQKNWRIDDQLLKNVATVTSAIVNCRLFWKIDSSSSMFWVERRANQVVGPFPCCSICLLWHAEQYDVGSIARIIPSSIFLYQIGRLHEREQDGMSRKIAWAGWLARKQTTWAIQQPARAEEEGSGSVLPWRILSEMCQCQLMLLVKKFFTIV